MSPFMFSVMVSLLSFAVFQEFWERFYLTGDDTVPHYNPTCYLTSFIRSSGSGFCFLTPAECYVYKKAATYVSVAQSLQFHYNFVVNYTVILQTHEHLPEIAIQESFNCPFFDRIFTLRPGRCGFLREIRRNPQKHPSKYPLRSLVLVGHTFLPSEKIV